MHVNKKQFYKLNFRTSRYNYIKKLSQKVKQPQVFGCNMFLGNMCVKGKNLTMKFRKHFELNKIVNQKLYRMCQQLIAHFCNPS
jgi:hypothetical protein